MVESVPEIRLPIAKGEIALDLGWRKMPDGIRVGMWSDNNGQFSEVKLSNEFVIGMDKTDDIQSIRKNMFNESVARLRNWKQETITLPEWFTERTKTLSLWKAIAKLASLTLFWRDNRFADDESIFTQMEEWRKRDKHLYEYEGNLRDRLLRNRREQYRIFAHWITQHYRKSLSKTSICVM